MIAVSLSGQHKVARAARLGWRRDLHTYGPCCWLKLVRRWKRERRRTGR
jgi:hypothetical protein